MIGPDRAKVILNMMADTLRALLQKLLPPKSKLLLVDRFIGDDFVVMYTVENRPKKGKINSEAMALSIALSEAMNKKFFGQTGWHFQVRVGFSYIIPDGKKEIEHLVYMSLREAQKVAQGLLDPKKAELLVEFKEVLRNEDISIVYQPIVSLESGKVLGWEALARGPSGYFSSPMVFFKFAEEVSLLYPLEKVCRKKSIDIMGKIDREQKLFLNINPLTICDPVFVRGETLEYIKPFDLVANNIVFEITEQFDIKSFPHFNKTIEYYRKQGYLIAVDDFGSGFSNLHTIANIKPDFLKMDIELVRGIDIDPVKKALIETFVAFSEKIGCKIIAEGIETKEELSVLMDLGVHYGQGYLLAKPCYPKPEPANEIVLKIHNTDLGGKRKFWRYTVPVSDIMENCHTLCKNTNVMELNKYFEGNCSATGVVVLEGKKVLGIVMRQNLYKKLCTQYGMSLFKINQSKT